MSDQQSALIVRQKLKESWQQEMLSIFDLTFGALNKRGSWLHLDRLEISLKVNTIDELGQKLADALPGVIEQKINSLSTADGKGFDSELGPDSLDYPTTSLAGARQESTTLHWNNFDLIEFYLVYGFKPWFIQVREFESILQSQLPGLQKELIESTIEKKDIKAWYRLIDLFVSFDENGWHSTIITKLLNDSSSPAGPIYKRLIQQISSQQVTFSAKRYDQVWAVILVLALLDSTLKSQLSQTSSLGYVIPSPNQWHKLIEDLDLSKTERGLMSDVMSDFDDLMSTSTDFLQLGDTEEKDTTQVDFQNDLASRQISELTRSSRRSDEHLGLINNTDTDQEHELAFSVDYAGLVLIAPFLKRFLVRQGINVEQDRLAHADVAYAAKLLFAVATGQSKCHEYDLGFIKLLLGLEFDSLISIGIPLNKADVAAANELIEAVIEHWSALGAVSVNGFRHSFLCRSAMLGEHDSHWQLSFERLGHDVLLDRLPWSLQLVKLPWMRKPINVNW